MIDLPVQECKMCHAQVLVNPFVDSVVTYEVAETWLPLAEGIFGLAIGMVKGHAVHWCRGVEGSGA